MLMLGRMDEEVAIALFAIGGGVVIIAIIAHAWLGARRAAYDARLKQLMIERGMAAGEIEQVLRAKSECDPSQHMVDLMTGKGRIKL